MSVDEEIEVIETTIYYLETIVNELKGTYFSDKIGAYEEDILELQQRLDELEDELAREHGTELRALEHEYWQSQL